MNEDILDHCIVNPMKVLNYIVAIAGVHSSLSMK